MIIEILEHDTVDELEREIKILSNNKQVKIISIQYQAFGYIRDDVPQHLYSVLIMYETIKE